MVTYWMEASVKLLHQLLPKTDKKQQMTNYSEIKCVLSRFVMARSFLYALLHASTSEAMANKETTDLSCFFWYHFEIMLHLTL